MKNNLSNPKDGERRNPPRGLITMYLAAYRCDASILTLQNLKKTKYMSFFIPAPRNVVLHSLAKIRSSSSLGSDTSFLIFAPRYVLLPFSRPFDLLLSERECLVTVKFFNPEILMIFDIFEFLESKYAFSTKFCIYVCVYVRVYVACVFMCVKHCSAA